MGQKTTFQIKGPHGQYTEPDLEKRFRGTFAHPELFYLHEAGDLTSTEFVLCLHIDSLVQARGIGCYASNSYFAEILKVTTTHVSRSIAKLIDLGLVVIITKDPRILETTWSRIKAEPCSPPLNLNVKPTLNINVHHTKGITVLPNTVAAAGAADDGVEEPMLLDGYGTTPQKIKHTDEHVRWATALKEALQSKQIMVGKKISVKKWAAEFAKLVDQKGSAEEVKKVLDWYLPRVGQDFVPQAFSAKAFVNKYDKIKLNMIKDQKDNPTYQETKLGERVTEWSGRFHWPNGVKQDLRPRVEQSITNYQEMHSKLIAFKKTQPKLINGRVNFTLTLCTALLTHLSDPETYLNQWFKDVFRIVHKKKEFKNIGNYVFSKDHWLFQSKLKNLVVKESLPQSALNQLLEVLK